MSRSRGSSRLTFFRLCSRAPWMAMVVLMRGVSSLGRALVEVGGLFHRHTALWRQEDGEPRLADDALVRQPLAGDLHAFHIHLAAEVMGELGGGAGAAGLLQELQDRPEEDG